MEPISRRNFIAGAATATVVTGLSPTATAQTDSNNLYDILRQYHFVGQDGQLIDKALKAKLDGKFVVVSFFYNGCGLVDTETLPKQAELANAIKPKELVHLVIDTHTYNDVLLAGSTLVVDSGLSSDIKKAAPSYFNDKNALTLYPVTTNATGNPMLFDTPEKATETIWKLENATAPSGGTMLPDLAGDDPGHYPFLTMYGPDGNPVRDEKGYLFNDASLITPSEVTRWATAAKAQRSLPGH